MTLARSDRGEDYPVISVSGELDIVSAGALREAVELVIAGRPERLVFDLSDLTFMDSSGISVMVDAANRVGLVELQNVSPIVRRIVEATGLGGVLKMDEPAGPT